MVVRGRKGGRESGGERQEVSDTLLLSNKLIKTVYLFKVYVSRNIVLFFFLRQKTGQSHEGAVLISSES